MLRINLQCRQFLSSVSPSREVSSDEVWVTARVRRLDTGHWCQAVRPVRQLPPPSEHQLQIIRSLLPPSSVTIETNEIFPYNDSFDSNEALELVLVLLISSQMNISLRLLFSFSVNNEI